MNEHFRIAGAQELCEHEGRLFLECFLASEDIKWNRMNLNEHFRIAGAQELCVQGGGTAGLCLFCRVCSQQVFLWIPFVSVVVFVPCNG